MRFIAACTTEPDQAKEPTGSCEQIVYFGLGKSPWFPRTATREEFKAAMRQWNRGIEFLDGPGSVTVIYRGRVVVTRSVHGDPEQTTT